MKRKVLSVQIEVSLTYNLTYVGLQQSDLLRLTEVQLIGRDVDSLRQLSWHSHKELTELFEEEVVAELRKV